MDKKPKSKSRGEDYLLGVFPYYDAIKEINVTLPFRYSIAEETYLFLLQSGLTKDQIDEVADKIRKQIDGIATAQAIWEAYEAIIGRNTQSSLVVGEFLPSSTQKQYLTTKESSCYTAIFLICLTEVIVQLEIEFDSIKCGYSGDEWAYQKNAYDNHKLSINKILEDIYTIFQRNLPKDNTKKLYEKAHGKDQSVQANKKRHEHSPEIEDKVKQYISGQYASLTQLFPSVRATSPINFTELAIHVFWKELSPTQRYSFAAFQKIKDANKNTGDDELKSIIAKEYPSNKFRPYKTLSEKASTAFKDMSDKQKIVSPSAR